MTLRPFFATLLVAGSAYGACTPTSVGLPCTTGTIQYDGSGNITAIGNDTLTYDGLSRLTAATLPSAGNVSQTYTYDSFGNLTRTTTNANGTSSTLDSDTMPSTNRMSAASYDDAGGVTSVSGMTFTYDASGMATSVTGANGGKTVEIYTADDERIATLNTSGSKYVATWRVRGVTPQVLRELHEDTTGVTPVWSWNRDYTYRGTQMLAASLPAVGAEAWRHYHLDHLGTPRLITDNSGSRVSVHHYYPYGEEVTSIIGQTETQKFTGHERDFVGGTVDENKQYVDYMHGRSYSPLAGSFLSVDRKRSSAAPLLPETWNRYWYATSNPLKYVDPDGRDIQIAAGSDVEKIRGFLAATMSRPGGRADVMALLNNHSFTLTMTTGSLNSPAKLHLDFKTTGKTTVEFGQTIPTNYSVVLDASGKGHTVASTATMTLDTQAIAQWHKDKSGVTTTAHEFHHALAIMNQQNAVLGDFPTSATGPAEQHGQAVKAESTDKSEDDMLKIIMADIPIVQVPK